ncbi:MAG: hypothetical protein A3A65_02915 [Candidatus Chisholmbacteria bacterium RIFCSPLOWO2_01_FULL_49_14]|uniref:AFP-like domain-containing protein n=1 Tax=Candidatus Chisholmbacteria bacterium RIFCSPLOWO2_01_FULL_49_14 TaxID=1797593 RepID=A0A1G1W2V7_9BACT|nr:MAG: hypothetical protein A3A65_02915 [Candidatus Chisholmbacteria bacterium RIFCSPLOWO2_01_FULL_49_14]
MQRQKEITIGKTKIGGNSPCFIVAEIGINHDGNLDQALKLIDIAADAKCSAVKFQLFNASRMYVKGAGKYRVPTGEKKEIIKIVQDAVLPETWIATLKNYSASRGLLFFSSVFDEHSADVLERHGVDLYKIASYEMTHIPLFRHVARIRKPIIFSCGGARIREVAEAMEVIEAEQNRDIVLMHCMAKYPTALMELNLNILKTLKLAFPNAVIGHSDHSADPTQAAEAAVALGAKVIEKHITLDNNLPGPDHSFALNPRRLRKMVKVIRNTEQKVSLGEKVHVNPAVLGSSERKTFAVENYVRHFCYRGVFTTKRITLGERFGKRNIAVLRPGEIKNGLHPRYFELLIKGYKSSREIPEARGLVWNDVLLR